MIVAVLVVGIGVPMIYFGGFGNMFRTLIEQKPQYLMLPGATSYMGVVWVMSTLILTTTTLIPLLMVTLPPKLRDHEDERRWENRLAGGITLMLTGPLKWIPVAAVVGILWLSAHYAELGRGILVTSALVEESGEVVARIEGRHHLDGTAGDTKGQGPE